MHKQDDGLKIGVNAQRCTECQSIKPFEAFYKNKGGKYGRVSKCIPCHNWLSKKHRENNQEYYKNYQNEYRKDNPKYNSNWIVSRKKEDPSFKIAHNIRSRIHKVLQRKKVSESTEELLGCSYEELKEWLENQFEIGMTWENHGTVWHIDHDIPCAKFDLTDPHQRAVCFHYSNLQPMFAIENMKKNTKINIF